MQQPEGFVVSGAEMQVCRLRKSLYGLKQSPRQWYKKFDSYMLRIGYSRCEFNCCVYMRLCEDGSPIYLMLYADDMLLASKNLHEIARLKALLSREFEMKNLGAAKKILGMEIHRDRGNGRLWLTHMSYLEKIVELFGMGNAKVVSTPLANHFKLSNAQCPKSEEGIAEMKSIPYASAVWSLMYAMVCTRPDIAHAFGLVSRFMSNPGKEYWCAVKWILRYLKGTANVGLLFDKQSSLSVCGYVDADFAGDIDNRRSTMGYVFTLVGGPVSWKSTLQATVALSTTNAEYMAATEAAKEALRLKGLIKELGILQGGVPLLCDSQSAICFAKN